jgi:N-carbamoyl-L-amino-acid hydrolase
MAHQALIAKGDIAKHVSGARLWNRLMELAQFGALPKGGVNRQALSGEEFAARACLVRWAKTIGLEPSTDAAANLFLSYRGKEPALPPVLIGSHIDSQPTGGKFDGALGVLAALESVEAIIANRVRPRRTVEIVAWMNEEGSRFAPGMMGSAVFSGARKLSDILTVRDAAGVSVESELHRLLTAEPQLRQRPFGMKPAAFLEIHIEQGPVLENKNKSVGIGLYWKPLSRMDRLRLGASLCSFSKPSNILDTRAGSTGRCNTGVKSLCWVSKSKVFRGRSLS